MCDNPVYLEPTFTFNGIPTLPAGCQASVCSGRQKAGCGYPPSFGQESKLRETAFWACLINKRKDDVAQKAGIQKSNKIQKFFTFTKDKLFMYRRF